MRQRNRVAAERPGTGISSGCAAGPSECFEQLLHLRAPARDIGKSATWDRK